jgi:hypothetical protein
MVIDVEVGVVFEDVLKVIDQSTNNLKFRLEIN